MMPPKKSKAARELDDPPEEKQTNGTAAEEEEVEHKNIFQVEIINSKRERTVPLHEVFTQEWINDNLEEKSGATVNFADIYEHYIDACQAKNCNAQEEYVFIKTVKQSFPEGFTVKETSVMHGDVKERKKIVRKEKVEGETMKLRMKDIVLEGLEGLGNPRNGVRFNTLMKAINVNYPALRLDINSAPLLRSLNGLVDSGTVYLVKGIGKAGFYRIWKEDEEDEEEEKEEDKKEEEGGEEKDEKKEHAEEEKEENAEGSGEKSGEGEKGADAPKKRKKSKGRKKKKAAPKRARIVHSDPQRVQDCFPLAMTYMSEPKIASVKRIKKYLADYYDYDNDSGLKKTLENGLEKGWWSLVSGSISHGSIELLISEFDPTDDDDTVGKIVNALTACTEPKQCSALLLKSYVIDYHPEFQVSEKPFKFKKALLSAVNSNIVRQLSGIGCSGTFQLVEQFTPGPHILAGKDTESDYEEVTSDEEGSLGEVGDDGFDLGYFETSNYTPRPSKRRGKARPVAPIQKLTYMPTVPKRRVKKPKGYTVKKGKRVKYEDSDSEEASDTEEEEEEEEPAYRPKGNRNKSRKGGAASKGRGRPAKKAAPAPRKAQKGSRYTGDYDDSEEEEEAYLPTPSKSRSTPSKGRGRPAAKKATPTPRRGQKKSKYVEESEEEEEQMESEEEEAPPTKARGRGRPPAKRAAPSPRSGGKKPRYVEESEPEEEVEEGEEEEEAPAPAPKKGRGRPAGKGKKRRR